MSRIDELIARLASDGVEYRALGELGELIRGRRFTKADYVDDGLESIHYGEIYTTYGLSATETVSRVRPELRNQLRLANPGDLVIAATGENADEVGKAVAWLGDGPVAVHDDCYIFRHPLDPKFVAYCFQAATFHDQKSKYVSDAKLSRVSGRDLAKIRIPVPPPEVQVEIVRVLDQFVELGAELEARLEAELEARRLQYDHYRERLLSFPTAPRRAMGEVGAFARGRRFTRDDVRDEGIPSIHYGEIYTHYGVSAHTTLSHVRADLRAQLRFAAPGDVVIAAVGETVEDVAKAVAWLGEGPVAIHDDTFAFRSELDPKFVSYFLQTRAFHEQKNRYVARAKVKRLSGEGLSRVGIPVPSADEQARAVASLDRLDTLFSDLTIGLPAEITARRRQYEHYRDRLLTFEETLS